MNLPNDIHLKIEKSPDKEDILLLLARLENDGVTITNDVYAAIVATLGFKLIKSTIQGLRQGRQMRGSFAPVCRSELRYGGSPSTC